MRDFPFEGFGNAGSDCPIYSGGTRLNLFRLVPYGGANKKPIEWIDLLATIQKGRRAQQPHDFLPPAVRNVDRCSFLRFSRRNPLFEQGADAGDHCENRSAHLHPVDRRLPRGIFRWCNAQGGLHFGRRRGRAGNHPGEGLLRFKRRYDQS